MSEHDEFGVSRESAPDHGPTFWADLESTFEAEPRADSTRQSPTQPVRTLGEPTTVMAPVANDQTAPLPRVLPAATRPDAGSRSRWPLAAAAALLVVVALGFVALRDSSGSDTTDLVAGIDEGTEEVVPLQGPEDGQADPVNADETNPGDAEPGDGAQTETCLLYTSPSPRDATLSRMPSSA